MSDYVIVWCDVIVCVGIKFVEYVLSYCCFLFVLWMVQFWQFFVVCFSNYVLCFEDLWFEDLIGWFSFGWFCCQVVLVVWFVVRYLQIVWVICIVVVLLFRLFVCSVGLFVIVLMVVMICCVVLILLRCLSSMMIDQNVFMGLVRFLFMMLKVELWIGLNIEG